MRSMVKFHDLVDLAKASMSCLPRDKLMELDEAIGNQDEDIAGTPANPGEANLGFS